jgi:hypothetical protein
VRAANPVDEVILDWLLQVAKTTEAAMTLMIPRSFRRCITFDPIVDVGYYETLP